MLMDTHKAIKIMLKLSDITQDRISTELGRSKYWLSSTFHAAQDSRAGTVAAIANICGYKLALVPSDSVPANALIIDPPNK